MSDGACGNEPMRLPGPPAGQAAGNRSTAEARCVVLPSCSTWQGVWCCRYAAQVQFLPKAAGRLASGADGAGGLKVSDEAKEHMRQGLREAMSEDRPTG